MQGNLIEVLDLHKEFPVRSGIAGRSRGVTRAVNGISFEIRKGETLGLVGESGSGKSTTGRLLLRLIEPTAGACLFEGQNVYELDRPEMRRLRREMQIVFQDPYGAFNPRMTVGRIIGEGLELRGVTDPVERDAEVARLLELVNLPPSAARRYPHEFSGGQRQRIGIARSLAVEPSFLVADEPVSALDVSTQAEVINLLLELQSRLGLTMLFISHDLSVVRVMSDRVAVMFAGKIMEMATTQSLFAHPLHPYTRELLAAVPEPDPKHARRAAAAPRDTRAESAAAMQEAGCPFAARCPHVMDTCRVEMPPLVDYAPRLGENERGGEALSRSEPHWAACHWTAQQAPIES